MDTKFTPGPWGLETVTTSCGICHKIGPFPYKLNAKPVAACVYVDYPGDGVIEAELKANAILMQSAPDLLAACQQAEADSSMVSGSALLLQLRAAIAKATGAA